MKVAKTVLMVAVFVLAAGVAFAQLVYVEHSASSSSADSPLFNGITAFDVGPDCDCAGVRGAAAGGYIAEAEPPLMNGATYFELPSSDKVPTGLCAGKLSVEPEMWVNNGITIFQ